jgi:hypothetical protein
MSVSIDLVEIFPEAIDQTRALLPHTCKREIAVGLAGVGRGVTVTLTAESVNRRARLFSRDASGFRPRGFRAFEKANSLPMQCLRRAVDGTRIRVRPRAANDHRRVLPTRHADRRADRYHLIPSPSQICKGPLYAPTLSA